MEEKKFRSKGFGYIAVIAIMVISITLALSFLILELTNSSELYALIAFPTSFVTVLIWFNKTKHVIVINENFISAPSIKSSFNNENSCPSICKFQKNRTEILFNEVDSFTIEYEFIHRTAFILLIFNCKDGSLKKIDTKRFSKRQFNEIRNLVRQKIKEKM